MKEDFAEEGGQDFVKFFLKCQCLRFTLPTVVNPEFPEFEIWESSDNFQACAVDGPNNVFVCPLAWAWTSKQCVFLPSLD